MISIPQSLVKIKTPIGNGRLLRAFTPNGEEIIGITEVELKFIPITDNNTTN